MPGASADVFSINLNNPKMVAVKILPSESSV